MQTFQDKWAWLDWGSFWSSFSSRIDCKGCPVKSQKHPTNIQSCLRHVCHFQTTLSNLCYTNQACVTYNVFDLSWCAQLWKWGLERNCTAPWHCMLKVSEKTRITHYFRVDTTITTDRLYKIKQGYVYNPIYRFLSMFCLLNMWCIPADRSSHMSPRLTGFIPCGAWETLCLLLCDMLPA